MRYEGKTGVITGGASGMGRLTAWRLLEGGGNAVIADANPAAFPALEEAFAAHKERLMCRACDVRDYGQIQATVDACMAKFGTIDYLFNYAGGESARMCGSTGNFVEKPVEVIEWGLDVNLKGPVLFSRAVLPHMMEQRSGVIILLGSITGHEGSAHAVDYAAAKSGLMTGLVKSLAQLGAPYNIRACCVAPGPVLTRPAMANMKTLIGRAAEPEEIVDLVEFLISDGAGSITGSTYLIDGGRSCMTH
ncbi:MAG: SDR family oxidoreductase [Clostridia bacterium]|nr:SDR family oxidoreductase [Clostridia bacterium]MBR4444150.1 SDR family oxidoreductase [Clostridia bacterium]